MPKLAHAPDQNFPENYAEKLEKFKNIKSSSGTEALESFIEGLENDLSMYTIDIIQKKYGLSPDWTYDQVNQLKDELIEELFVEEEVTEAKPEADKDKKYPKRYEKIYNDLKNRIIELFIQKKDKEAKKILEDLHLLYASSMFSMFKSKKPETLQNYNFRNWSTMDYAVLHEELSELFEEENKQKAITKSKIKKVQTETQEREKKERNKRLDDMNLWSGGINGKILELELLGGSQAQAKDYDSRQVVNFLIKNDQLISSELKNQFSEEEYSDLTIKIRGAMNKMAVHAQSYAKSRTEKTLLGVLADLSKVKQNFLNRAGINKSLARRCLIDALYRVAIFVANPAINPGDPESPYDENVFQKGFKLMHTLLAKKLINRGIIEKREDLKFFSAIGSPLDLGASCDAVFFYKDKKGQERVIPVDITMRPNKVLKGPKYGEVFMYYKHPEIKLPEKEEFTKKGLKFFTSTVESELLKRIKNFVQEVDKKITMQNIGQRQGKIDEFNYSDGLTELLELKESFQQKEVQGQKQETKKAA
ncbi:hypothetical protein GF354_02355 [Candidatus Peregrinibacteria bacterium]|nr:hypothetical protein [Candidatus Peregrinibacteria bacterium]